MTADDVIKIIGAVSGAAVLLGLPALLKNRKPTVTSDSVTKMILAERDRLQTRLDATDARHEKELRDVQDRAASALAAAQAEIAQLRTEIDGLYRRLYTPPAP